MSPTTSAELQAFVRSQRVARLATTDSAGQPHLVPICFVYDGARFYTVIDQKPKRVSPLRLKRVRNIRKNPRVALLLDHYEESWDNLSYVLVQGTARLVKAGPEREVALSLLREKYSQYQLMDLEVAPVIEITPEEYIVWGKLRS